MVSNMTRYFNNVFTKDMEPKSHNNTPTRGQYQYSHIKHD